MSVKLGLSHKREDYKLMVCEQCAEDLRERKLKEGGEYYKLRIFIICDIQQILG
jgi:hypothetical protein